MNLVFHISEDGSEISQAYLEESTFLVLVHHESTCYIKDHPTHHAFRRHDKNDRNFANMTLPLPE